MHLPFRAFRAPRQIFALPAVALALLLPSALNAQDRLKTMPGYDAFIRMQTALGTGAPVKAGTITPTWSTDGRSFEYNWDGKRNHFDVASKKISVVGEATNDARNGFGRGGGGGPARGRQADVAISPDSQLKAVYRERNLYIANVNGSGETRITNDGSVEKRIKYGTASWVYGEELAQTTAFWWAPASKYLAYYRFDESGVPDYFLQLDQTKIQSTVDTEAYPKSGVVNPVVDLYVYNITTKQSVKIDVRDGKPLDNSVVGHYVYKVGWSPDGQEITFNRTNRRQNIMEFTACSPDNGKCRVVVREEWPTWVENRPFMQYLKDNKRFIWASERSGYRNFYLYDMTGKLITPITTLNAEVANVVKVDEATNTLWYMARDGENHLKMQLHRVGLDGKGDKRLTDPAFNHAISLSPDGKYFTDVEQTHDMAPVTRVIDATTGKAIADVASSDLTKFDALRLRKVEMFTFLAADGKTTLRGTIAFPSTFDPSRKYPILMSVYGGPASGSNTPTEQFSTPSATAEYGFLLVNLESRAAPGMGKRTLDAIYEKLGQVEMDDMAEGIKALYSRPYVDKAHVGVYGTSYGGYSSAMLLLRHPEVFTAAAAQSPVTDWRNYDTIYTERYMWIPQENKAGYDAGSAMTYAPSLKGRLMLYYGTADNNVHPNNMMQLISALQKAGKSFDVQVGPDQGHSSMNNARMMEFFIENLMPRTNAVQ